MPQFLETLLSNPVYIGIAVVIVLVLLYSVVKRIIKLIIFIIILVVGVTGLASFLVWQQRLHLLQPRRRSR